MYLSQDIDNYFDIEDLNRVTKIKEMSQAKIVQFIRFMIAEEYDTLELKDTVPLIYYKNLNWEVIKVYSRFLRSEPTSQGNELQKNN